LRSAPFPRRCSGTFCQPWSLLRKALIRAGKTSPTAETLCAIGFELVDKIIEKYYDGKTEEIILWKLKLLKI
jgi:hypothetical protein